jgi:hypothetical protein
MRRVGVLVLCASTTVLTMMWNPGGARAAVSCSWDKEKDAHTYKERCEFDGKDAWETWARAGCENVPGPEPQKYRDCLAERYKFADELKSAERQREAGEKAERQLAVARQKAAEGKRIANIRAKKWPANIEKAIIDNKILLGMTDEQVRMAWGKPETINRSVGSWGIHEQWAYGSTYLYFENELLKNYQERR